MGRRKLSTSKTYYQRHKDQLLKKAREKRVQDQQERLPKVFANIELHKSKIANALQCTTVDFRADVVHLSVELMDLFRPCVYIYYAEDQTPIYVGSSSQGFMRVFSARYDKYADRRYLTECCRTIILWCSTIEEARDLEIAFIEELKPRYNKKGLTKPEGKQQLSDQTQTKLFTKSLTNTRSESHSVDEIDNE